MTPIDPIWLKYVLRIGYIEDGKPHWRYFVRGSSVEACKDEYERHRSVANSAAQISLHEGIFSKPIPLALYKNGKWKTVGNDPTNEP